MKQRIWFDRAFQLELPPESFLEIRERVRGTPARLDALDDDALRASALHPRLEQPMTNTDLNFFVAEHDDHHLATIHQIVG